MQHFYCRKLSDSHLLRKRHILTAKYCLIFGSRNSQQLTKCLNIIFLKQFIVEINLLFVKLSCCCFIKDNVCYIIFLHRNLLIFKSALNFDADQMIQIIDDSRHISFSLISIDICIQHLIE